MRRLIVAAALSCALALPCIAADGPGLTAAAYPPAQILPAPPADGSPAQKRELDEIHQAQSGMTEADFARAAADDKAEDASAFNAVVGVDLKVLPKTWALLATVRNEEKGAAKLAKNYFQSNRPWVLDPALKTCTRADAPQSSYPSGHSTMGYSMAIVLAALVPDKAPAILDRARTYAENRIVCGVHYRSDIVAGQALGTAVAEKLLADPRFAADFGAAKSELQNAINGTH